MTGENGCRLAREYVVRLGAEQDERVAGGAVECSEAAVVVVLPPQSILSTPGPQHRRRFARRLRPALLTRPLVHGEQREQCPWDAPIDVVGPVLRTRREEGVEVLGKHHVSCELEGDEQGPRFAQEQRRSVVVRLAGLDVGLGSEEVERPLRCRGKVERRFCAAPFPQRVERPDHARSTDVQVLERQRRIASVPLMRWPERIVDERRIGVPDDRSDRIFDTRRNPRPFDQRLELRRLIEHSHRLLLVHQLTAANATSPGYEVKPLAIGVGAGIILGATVIRALLA